MRCLVLPAHPVHHLRADPPVRPLDIINQAACAPHPPEWWDADNVNDARLALSICRTCNVPEECADRVLGKSRAAYFTGVAGATLWVDGRQRAVPPWGTPTIRDTCGTLRGRRLHKINREPYCDPCRRPIPKSTTPPEDPA